MTDKTDNTIRVADTDITIKRVKVKNLNDVTRAFTPFVAEFERIVKANNCLLYTSPSPRDRTRSRMPSSA